MWTVVVENVESLRICLRVIRPHIVVGGLLGYCLGVLLALVRGGRLDPAALALGYAVVLFGDLSTHFSNDYYDVDLDRGARRKALGSSYVLVEHPEARALAGALAVALTAASFLTAVSLVLLGSPPSLLAIVAVTNLLGWLYSAPPVHLNARGLGEVTIALGTGFVIPALGYIVAQGGIDQAFLNLSAPLVLYGLILSLSLELPDLEADREGGRTNLVVMLGRRPTSLLVLLLSAAATTIFTLVRVIDIGPPWMLPLLSAAPLMASLNTLRRSSDSHAEADRVSILNISALSLFLVTLDAHLLLSLL
jgi:1,4-dihydroxy-2-naphthoate octaprenyltransferase